MRHYNEEDIETLLQSVGFKIQMMRRYQKMFESEMITFYFGVKGFQRPIIYPLMRLYAALDIFLPRTYPGVGLLTLAQKSGTS